MTRREPLVIRSTHLHGAESVNGHLPTQELTTVRARNQLPMKTKKVINEAHKLAKPFCVTNGDNFVLKDFDPGDTLGLKSADKPRAQEALEIGIHALTELQDILYAQGLAPNFPGDGRRWQRWRH